MITAKKILFPVLLIFFSVTCYAQPTNVSGTIAVNTTWMLSGSPYVLTGDVIVNPGVTLTIDPGVEVNFGHGDDLFVDGTLLAIGTSVDSIRFVGETTNDGGIDFRDGGNGTIDYAVFNEMGDDIGGRLHALYKSGTGALTIDHSRFVGNRNGIRVLSGAAINVDNTTIEFCNEYGVRVEEGTMTMTNSMIRGSTDKGVYLLDTATIQNTTFEGNGSNSDDCAIHIEAAIVPILDNNIFIGNYIDVITHPEIMDDTYFDSNGLSKIHVDGGTNITQNTTWHFPPESWSYEFLGDVTVNTGITLTIEPGVEMIFTSGDDLFVSGNLVAVGNSTDSIFFFGGITDDGVVELLSGSTAQFDYVSMTEMGDNINGRGFAIDIETTNSVTVDHSRFYECRNGIRVNNNATPTITNSLFETSGAYAVDVVLGNPTISGNTFTNTGSNGIHLLDTATIQNNSFLNNGNGAGESAIFIDDVVVPVIDNNTFSGNIRDIITHPEIMDDTYFDNNGIARIHIDNNRNITTNTTWHFPQSPESWDYELLGDVTVDAGVTLTIEPSVVLNFTGNDNLLVSGNLIAVGTTADSIFFIGEGSDDGVVDILAGSTAQFEYVRMTEMGDNINGRGFAIDINTTNSVTINNSKFFDCRGAVRVRSDATPLITNSVIENGDLYGIYVELGSPTITGNTIQGTGTTGIYLLDTATIQNNTFIDNIGTGEDAAVHIAVPIVPVIENNVFTGNSIDLITHPEIVDDLIFDTNGLTEIFIDDQSVTVNTTWHEPILPEDWIYRIFPDVTVDPGVTLTIDPGVWVFFSANDDLFVEGDLIAVGTPTDSIRFIGETTNDGGIDLLDGSNASFDYVVFDEMGDDTGARLHALYKRGAGTVTIDNSRFVNNRNGISVLSGASVDIDNTTIESSNEYGVRVEDGTMLMTNSLVRGNLDKGVYLLDTATIQNTTFDGNGANSEDCALHIEAAIVPVLDNNVFTNNYIDVITHPEIVDDEIFDTNGLTEIHLDNQNVTVNTSWQEPVLPEDWTYRIIGDITVNPGVTLTIEPGVWMYFGNNDDLFIDGTLSAIATPSDSIRFIGETTNDGGIDFQDGSNGGFDYVVFDEMGDDIGGKLHALYKRGTGNLNVDHSRFTGNRNGIQVLSGASISIDNTTIENCNEYGVRVENGTMLLTNSLIQGNQDKGIYLLDTASIQNTTFSNNGLNLEDCGLHIDAAIVPILDNNVFTNNFIDVITHPEIVDDEIFDTNGFSEIYIDNKPITVNSIWSEPILPEDWIYRLTGDVTVNAGVTLTIEPGVWVYLSNNDDLFIEGTLIAEGTMSSTIKFIGETTNDGGIDLIAGSSGSFDYVEFEEMGDDIGGRLTALYIRSSAVTVDNSYFDGCRRGIFVDNGAVPDISNTVFRGSNEFGIVVENGAPTITSSRLEQSGISGMLVNNGSPIISGSCIFDNTSFGINNQGLGTVDARNNWWGDPTGPSNDSLNASGLGDVMSAGVLFDPWNTIACDLAVGPPVIVIDMQPQDTIICDGGDIGFVVEASGDTGLTYQWQEDQGSGFVNLTNTGIYSGVLTNYLQIFNIPQTHNGYDYRCIVSGDLAEDVISDEVYVNVRSIPPVPGLSFTDSTICTATSLDIYASGVAEGSYLWYESASAITPISMENAGFFSTGVIDRDTTFYVSIVESCESARIPINIYYASPTITSQPVDVNVIEGDDVLFSVTATGNDLSYQWQKDGIDIAFETLPDFSLESVILTDGGDYTCVVTNSCGQTVSEIATLSIGEPPGPEFILSIIEDIEQVEVSGSVDLGETEVLVDLTRDFVIDNIGTNSIVVLDITSSNSTFSVTNIPTSIAIQSSESFGLVFNSDEAGRDSTLLSIQFQDSTFAFWVFAEATQEPANNPEIIIYNAVAPNGDGKHDFFKIENIESYSSVVQVFNRWGDKVFEVSGYDNAVPNLRFEGVRNVGSVGDLTEGTYFYIIDLRDGSSPKTGFLLLKR